MRKKFAWFDRLRAEAFFPKEVRSVALSLGLALSLAWWFAVVVSGLPSPLSQDDFSSIGDSGEILFVAVFFFSQSAAFAFMASTDQVLLQLYSSRVVLVGSCVAAALSVLLAKMFEHSEISFMGCSFAYFVMGVASAFLLMFWGVAYSRQGFRSIVACSLFAVFGAFALFVFLFLSSEVVRAGMLIAFPLVALLLLWGCTPASYVVRRAAPIFNPLPVNPFLFSVRLVIPMFFLGVTLAVFFCEMAMQLSLAPSVVDAAFAVFMAGFAVALVALFLLLSVSGFFWDYFLRVAVVAVAVCFSLTLLFEDADPWLLVSLTSGCILLFAVAWIFCGYVAQNFRISPILLFSASFAGISLGMIAGLFLLGMMGSTLWLLCVESGELCLIVSLLLLVEVFLPRPNDIKKAALSSRFSNSAKRSDQLDLRSWRSPEKVNSSEDCKGEGSPGVANEEDTRGASSKQEIDSGCRQDEIGSEHSSGRFCSRCEEIANIHMLSSREAEILFLLAKGYSTTRITEEMFISKNTAKTHITHIYRKLHIHSRQELQKMVDSFEDASA